MAKPTEQEVHMPVAKVYVPEGLLTQDQRRDIVRGIHAVIVGVENKPASFPTYVLINEVAAGHWGSSGNVYAPRS
jgi:4-oxalocrotonate tautomerase family enzyme